MSEAIPYPTTPQGRRRQDRQEADLMIRANLVDLFCVNAIRKAVEMCEVASINQMKAP